jgi:hypothetical protein
MGDIITHYFDDFQLLKKIPAQSDENLQIYGQKMVLKTCANAYLGETSAEFLGTLPYLRKNS